MFAPNIFHQKATTSTAKGGGSPFNELYSPPPPPTSPPCPKSFQIKVTVLNCKLVKVPAIKTLNLGLMVLLRGGGGRGRRSP